MVGIVSVSVRIINASLVVYAVGRSSSSPHGILVSSSLLSEDVGNMACGL